MNEVFPVIVAFGSRRPGRLPSALAHHVGENPVAKMRITADPGHAGNPLRVAIVRTGGAITTAQLRFIRRRRKIAAPGKRRKTSQNRTDGQQMTHRNENAPEKFSHRNSLPQSKNHFLKNTAMSLQIAVPSYCEPSGHARRLLEAGRIPPPVQEDDLTRGGAPCGAH